MEGGKGVPTATPALHIGFGRFVARVFKSWYEELEMRGDALLPFEDFVCLVQEDLGEPFLVRPGLVQGESWEEHTATDVFQWLFREEKPLRPLTEERKEAIQVNIDALNLEVEAKLRRLGNLVFSLPEDWPVRAEDGVLVTLWARLDDDLFADYVLDSDGPQWLKQIWHRWVRKQNPRHQAIILFVFVDPETQTAKSKGDSPTTETLATRLKRLERVIHEIVAEPKVGVYPFIMSSGSREHYLDNLEFLWDATPWSEDYENSAVEYCVSILDLLSALNWSHINELMLLKEQVQSQRQNEKRLDDWGVFYRLGLYRYSLPVARIRRAITARILSEASRAVLSPAGVEPETSYNWDQKAEEFLESKGLLVRKDDKGRLENPFRVPESVEAVGSQLEKLPSVPEISISRRQEIREAIETAISYINGLAHTLRNNLTRMIEIMRVSSKEAFDRMYFSLCAPKEEPKREQRAIYQELRQSVLEFWRNTGQEASNFLDSMNRLVGRQVEELKGEQFSWDVPEIDIEDDVRRIRSWERELRADWILNLRSLGLYCLLAGSALAVGWSQLFGDELVARILGWGFPGIVPDWVRAAGLGGILLLVPFIVILVPYYLKKHGELERQAEELRTLLEKARSDASNMIQERWRAVANYYAKLYAVRLYRHIARLIRFERDWLRSATRELQRLARSSEVLWESLRSVPPTSVRWTREVWTSQEYRERLEGLINDEGGSGIKGLVETAEDALRMENVSPPYELGTDVETQRMLEEAKRKVVIRVRKINISAEVRNLEQEISMKGGRDVSLGGAVGERVEESQILRNKGIIWVAPEHWFPRGSEGNLHSHLRVSEDRVGESNRCLGFFVKAGYGADDFDFEYIGE